MDRWTIRTICMGWGWIGCAGADPSAKVDTAFSTEQQDSAADADTGARDCAAGIVSDLTVSDTRIATVKELSWTTPVPALVQVQVTDSRGTVTEAPMHAVPATDHRWTLLGLHELDVVTVVVRAEDTSGNSICVEPIEVETGAFPAALPAILGESRAGTDSRGWTLLPIITENNMLVSIVDGEGRLVWADVTWSRETSGGLFPVAFRARLDPAGRGIVYNTQGFDVREPGLLTTVAWDGTVLDQQEFPGGHTDFVLLPDGSSAMLGWTVREVGGRSFLGDTLLLRDTSGEVSVLWDVFDHLSPDLARRYLAGYPSGATRAEDWSHANGLSYNVDEDAFFVTVTEPSAVVRIERTSGAVSWILSPGVDDYTSVPDGAVDRPHSVQFLDGNLLVFNRSDPGNPGTCSQAIELALDELARTVLPVWQWASGVCLQNGFLGNAQRVSSGNTLVTWSSYGFSEEVSPDGVVEWTVATGIGAGMGFGTRVSRVDSHPSLVE